MSEIKLILGDCLKVMPELEEKSIDAIITDIPYGTTACSWDVVIPFEPMWSQVKRVLKPKGVFVTTSSQPFTSLLVVSNLKWFKYEWIWNKISTSSGFSAESQPLRSHENVLVFGENKVTYNPMLSKGTKWNRGGIRRFAAFTGNNNKDKKCKPDESDNKFPKSIIDFSNADKTNNLHPTQKPVSLYEYLILTYSNPGDTILDIAAGSGTTGVAAINTGRNCVLIEKDPDYYAIAEKRIHDAQMQPLLFEGT